MKAIMLDLKNYKENGTVYHRTAIRGIINRDNKYLMIHSKHGDYKFPGGGMNEGESYIETLGREVSEETGYVVISSSIIEGFHVQEKRKGDPADLLIMDSYYYYCNVKDETQDRNLDEYEKEYGYEVIWITLEEAISHNQMNLDMTKVPWVERETMIMKMVVHTITNWNELKEVLIGLKQEE